MYQIIGIVTLALSQFALAKPAPAPTAAPNYEKRQSCYTSTVTTPYTGVVFCPFIPEFCGPTPDCIFEDFTTITIPAHNTKCPITPTITVTGEGVCPTCQTGCATDIITVTVTA